VVYGLGTVVILADLANVVAVATVEAFAPVKQRSCTQALADKPAGNALLPFCYPTAEYEAGEGGTSWLEVYPRTEQNQSFKD
jgi:hypothetical protein